MIRCLFFFFSISVNKPTLSGFLFFNTFLQELDEGGRKSAACGGSLGKCVFGIEQSDVAGILTQLFKQLCLPLHSDYSACHV